MTTIDIKVDGSSIVDDVLFSQTRFVGMSDGNTGQAVVVVRNKSQYAPSDFQRGMKLELFIAGQREWDGWIFSTKRGWPFDVMDTTNPPGVSKFWTLVGMDRNVLFQKRVLFNQEDPSDPSGFKIWPEETSDREALLYVLDHYVDLSGDGLTVGPGIKQISTPGPDQEFTLANVSAPLGTAFNDASKVTGGVFFIDPDRVVQYRGDTDITAPFALSDVPGSPAGSIGYREATAWEDAMEMANESFVWGAGKGSSDPVLGHYRNAASVAEHGLWQWGDIFVGAYKQQTVNKRARTYVEGSPSHRRGHGEDVPSVDCTIFTPGIRVGHVVDFHMKAYDYNEPLPVRQLTITFPTTTDVRYDLELSLKVDMPFSAPDLWKRPANDTSRTAETLPPGGGAKGDPSDSTVNTGLIDHYAGDTGIADCGDAQLWTTQVKDAAVKGEWDIQLPVVPGGIQIGDIIFLHWTHTPMPDGPTFGTPNMPFVTGYGTSVRKIKNAAPSEFWLFSELNSYMIPGAPIGGRYLKVTGDMDFIGETAPSIKLYADSGETTAVAYVSGVLRGIDGVPGNMSGGIPAISFGVDPPTSLPINDSSIQGGDNYLYVSFAVLGGNDDDLGGTGDPLVAGQSLSGDVTPDTGGPFSIQELNTAPDANHPAFGMATTQREQDVGPYGYWQGVITVDGYTVDNATVAWGVKVGQNQDCAGPVIVGISTGKVIDASSATITLPAGCDVPGRQMILFLVHDPTGTVGELRDDLPDSTDGGVHPAGPGPYWLWFSGNAVAFSDFLLTFASSTVRGSEGYAGDGTDSFDLGTWPENLNVSWAVVLLEDDVYISADKTDPYVPAWPGLWSAATTTTKDPAALPTPSAGVFDTPEAWGPGSPAMWLAALGTNSSEVTAVPDGYAKIIDIRNSPENGLCVAVRRGRASSAEAEDPSAFETTSTYTATYLLGWTGQTSARRGAFTPDDWRTPGPEITGAPWPGGNTYSSSAGGAFSQSIIVEESSVVVSPGSWSFAYQAYWGIYDNWVSMVDDPDGTLTGQAGIQQGDWRTDLGDATPWGPWQKPMTWKILLKPTVLADTLRNGWFGLEHYFILPVVGGEPATYTGLGDFATAWAGEFWVGLYWYVEGGEPVTYLELYNAYDDGTGILPDVLADTSTDYDDGITDFETNGEWSHYWWKRISGTGLNIEPGEDYYLYIDVEEAHNAIAGSRWIKLKVWKASEPEPSDWDIVDVLPMYKGAADEYLGHENRSGGNDTVNGAGQSYWKAYAGATPSGGDETRVDAIWAPVEGASAAGTTVSEVPIYDSQEYTNAGLYTTRWPYVPNSLIVYYQGQRMVRNLDYFEIDPPSGQFRVHDPRDISSSLQVIYERYGSTTTGSSGSVYRPAPVLQYGWGSRLDGYNCTMACGCMALDRHTRGAYTARRGSPRATPPTMRSFQNDQVGGSDLGDVALAWSNGWGQSLTWGVYSWSAFVSKVTAGRGAILQGKYGNLPASKRFSSSFTGDHAIYINERLGSGLFWGFDPLYRQPVLYTAAELQSYAAGLSFVGSGQASAGFTKVVI